MMKKMLNQAAATVLSAVLVLLSPGVGAYSVFAQFNGAASPVQPISAASLKINSAAGSPSGTSLPEIASDIPTFGVNGQIAPDRVPGSEAEQQAVAANFSPAAMWQALAVQLPANQAAASAQGRVSGQVGEGKKEEAADQSPLTAQAANTARGVATSVDALISNPSKSAADAVYGENGRVRPNAEPVFGSAAEGARGAALTHESAESKEMAPADASVPAPSTISGKLRSKVGGWIATAASLLLAGVGLLSSPGGASAQELGRKLERPAEAMQRAAQQNPGLLEQPVFWAVAAVSAGLAGLIYWKGPQIRRGLRAARQAIFDYFSSSEKSAAAEKPYHPIVGKYMVGMLIYQGFYVTYYALFTTMAIFVVGEMAPAVGRLAYAAALILASPIAGVLVQSLKMRDVLIKGLWARTAVYAALAVAASFLPVGGLGIYTTFAVLMFIDGALISLYALVGPEFSGGVMMQKRFAHRGVTIDANDDNRMNAQLFFWLSTFRVLWAPIVAGLIFAMKKYMDSNVSVAVLSAMVGSAVLFSLAATFFGFRHIPKDEKLEQGSKTVKQAFQEMREGWQIIRKNPEEASVMVWISLKRALDDAMLLILVPMFVYKFLSPGNAAQAAVLMILVPALTKIGSILASKIQGRWKAPAKTAEPQVKYKEYNRFLRNSLVAGVVTLLMIAASSLGLHGFFWPALLLVVLTDNVFNYNTQRAQQGMRNYFRSLLDSPKLLAQANGQSVSSRIMGIYMTVSMTINSVLVVVPALFFAQDLPAMGTLIFTTVLFALTSLIEFTIGRKQQFSFDARNPVEGEPTPDARIAREAKMAREQALLKLFNRVFLAASAAGMLAAGFVFLGWAGLVGAALPLAYAGWRLYKARASGRNP